MSQVIYFDFLGKIKQIALSPPLVMIDCDHKVNINPVSTLTADRPMPAKDPSTTRSTAQSNLKVWDIWVRLSHWLIAFLFIGTVATALNHDFHRHKILAVILTALVLFRILWGLVGSKNARLKHFFTSPRQWKAQAKTLLVRKRVESGRHTPLGGTMALALLSLVLIQAAIALFMRAYRPPYIGRLSEMIPTSISTQLTDAHEIIGKIGIALAVIHILAALFYWIYKRSNLILAMITGRYRQSPSPFVPKKFASWYIALLCLIVAFVTTGLIFEPYNW